MSLSYKTQNPVVIIGSKTAAGVRTGIELESTYSTTQDTEPTKVIACGGFSKVALDILYTMGATETGNSIEVKIESSPDGTNFYRMPIDTVTTVSTLLAREWTFVGSDAAAATIGIITDIAYKYIRVSCKETGVVTNKGNVFVEATFSGR